MESINSELLSGPEISLASSNEYCNASSNELLINSDKHDNHEIMNQETEKILFVFRQLESEIAIQRKMPDTCLCGLPLESVLQNCNLNLTINHENTFYLCTVLLNRQQFDQICSLALLNNNWPMYLNLLAVNEKSQSKFFFYMSLLNDCSEIILKHVQTFNIDKFIWLQVLSLIGSHVNSNSEIIFANMEHSFEGKCRLCKIKSELNRNNYIMLWKFIEESILYPSLWLCSSEYILEKLMIYIMTLFHCEKKWQGPIFSIELYLLILQSFVMEYSITNRSVWFMKRFQQEIFCKKYNMDMNRIMNNDSEDNADIKKDNLDQLINQLKRRFLNSGQPNFSRTSQTIKKKQCLVLRLKRITCSYCNQSILYNKEGKPSRTFKLNRKCGHVFHLHCLGPFAFQYCKLCRI